MTDFGHARSNRIGLTLIEIMIALTMTLIVLGAMMQAFDVASKEMAKGRAVIELANQIRSAEEKLRSDLENATADPRPATIGNQANGYFEYVEGIGDDNTETYLGDVDDIISLTVRSTGVPFRGRFNGDIIESDLAEVVWFVFHNDPDSAMDNDRNDNDLIDFDESVDIYRRVLLIRPDLLANSGGFDWSTGSQATEFLNTNDVSVRPDGAGGFVPNSLAELAKRENRFVHNINYPHYFNRNGVGINSLVSTRMQAGIVGGGFELLGEDIVLTNVCAFDVRIFSPNASIVQAPAVDGGVANVNLSPGAPFYAEAQATDDAVETEYGAYVDLGREQIGGGGFADIPSVQFDDVKDTLQSDRVYCTWSSHYEFGREGTDGIDNDGMNGVDDPGERETSPPYLGAVRGIKVTIRAIEKKSKQVRQTSIIHSFVPQ